MRLPTSAAPGSVRRGGRPLAAAILAAVAGLAGPAIAKTPGHTYCFNDICHRVKTIAETKAMVGRTVVLQASYYDDAGKDAYNPSNQTSSGEYFRSDRPDNAASPVLPDGTKVLVWHAGSGRAVIVRINNAGPYYGRRMIDLSRAAAEKLGLTGSGVGTVHTRVLEAPTSAEATYRRGRKYPPVPGYIGRFGTMEMAMGDASRALGLPGAPTLVAQAAPPAPVRKPASAMTIAGLPPPVPVPAEPTIVVAAAEVAPMPLRPAVMTIADAAERMAAAEKVTATRIAMASLAQERARAVRVQAEKQQRIARAEEARKEDRRQKLAEARAGQERGKAQRVAEARRTPRKPEAKPDGEDDEQVDSMVQPTSAPAPRSIVVAQSRPTRDSEPDMNWVKEALKIN